MKQIIGWLALILVVVLAAVSHAEDTTANHTTKVYKTTEHEKDVTIERTTTTVRETTLVPAVKR
ncbi:MAG TPA: hypothetical protein VGG19_14060, partial [Tepidisphaeraceae bacterium]